SLQILLSFPTRRSSDLAAALPGAPRSTAVAAPEPRQSGPLPQHLDPGAARAGPVTALRTPGGELLQPVLDPGVFGELHRQPLQDGARGVGLVGQGPGVGGEEVAAPRQPTVVGR